MEKCLAFWRSKLKEKVSIVDIYNLAFEVWKEIHDEEEIDTKENYQECYVSKQDLEKLEVDGELELEAECGELIYLKLREQIVESATLESGRKLVWWNEEVDN